MSKMRSRFHYSSFIIHHFFIITLLIASARAASPIELLRQAPNRIVVLDYPLRYAKPSRQSESWQTGLRAGTMIRWIDIKAGDERTSHVLSGIEDPNTAPLNLWYEVEYEGKTGWLTDASLAVIPAESTSTVIGEERVDRWTGLAPNYKPSDLVAVGSGYEKDRQYLLRAEAAAAFKEMVKAARADGVTIQIVSGYRQWQTQQDLYQKRVKLSGPGQQTVAKPGHSEHQLGTAADLTDGDEKHLLEKSFGETEAGKWLLKNAPSYGFAISFTEQNKLKTGIAPEPWHYRYWGSSAAERHQSALE